MIKQIKDFFTKGANSKYSLYKSVGLQGDKKLSADGYLTLAEISLYVNKGINKRADKIGQVQFTLSKNGKEIEKHPILDLLDKPNEQMTGDTFWKLASYYHDTCGFAIIQKIGNDAVFTSNQKVTQLKLHNPSGTVINYAGDKIKSFTVVNEVTGQQDTIPYEECIYWVNPNPKKSTEGISLLQSGLYSIDLDNQLSRYHTSILKNGGSVESVFTFENVLTKEQLDNLKETYREEYANASNSGTPLFLGGDANFQKLGLSPAELAYLETKKVNIDDMAVITGVPKSILGITTGETFANADIAYRIFLRETIKPLIADLVNVLDWQLVPPDMELGFVDPTPEDTDIKLKTLETGDRVSALTTNEKREMLGLDPVKNGDEITVPFNRVPMTEAKSVKPIFQHPLKNKAVRERYMKYHTKSLQSNEDSFEKKLNEYFKAQEERVLSNVQAKKIAMVRKDVNEIFNVDLETKLAFPLLQVIKEIAKEAGQDVYDMFNLGSEFVFTSSLDASLSKRFNFWSRKINETTADELTKKLQDFVQNEQTLNELVDSIKETYRGVQSYRARAIATTEIGIATEEARLDGYKQVGIPTKVWVWSPGIKGGTRDDHQAMDGEEVPINGYFSNGMKHPKDPAFGAGELVNCACTL